MEPLFARTSQRRAAGDRTDRELRMAHETAQLDEKTYLEVFQPARPRGASKKKART